MKYVDGTVGSLPHAVCTVNPHSLMKLDTNGDHKLSKAELSGHPVIDEDVFNKLDKDGNKNQKGKREDVLIQTSIQTENSIKNKAATQGPYQRVQLHCTQHNSTVSRCDDSRPTGMLHLEKGSTSL